MPKQWHASYESNSLSELSVAGEVEGHFSVFQDSKDRREALKVD